MTEGEGRPVAIQDDDPTRPSPADAPPLSALQTARYPASETRSAKIRGSPELVG